MRRENTASNPWELDIGAVDDDEWSWFGGRLDGGGGERTSGACS